MGRNVEQNQAQGGGSHLLQLSGAERKEEKGHTQRDETKIDCGMKININDMLQWCINTWGRNARCI